MDYSEQHFESIYKANYRQMYRVAFSVLGDVEDARDAVSQVFALVWQRKPQIEEDSMTAYLLTIVRNRCLNIKRDKRLRVGIDTKIANEDTQQVAEHNELMDELQRVIRENLSLQDQRILDLRYGNNLSYEETAQTLGISTSAVNKHVTKSFNKIRALLKIVSPSPSSSKRRKGK